MGPSGFVRTPVTVVTGFLGAGKTTLLNHVLSAAPERRIGVLVNDFGDADIETHLVVARTEDVISLRNGCICCSLRQDVPDAVLKVLRAPTPPEHLWVEASGVSNPGALADLFVELQGTGVLRVDGIVVVADAEGFPADDLAKQPQARDQILAADLMVLNKADLVEPAQLEYVEARIRQRVPRARIVPAVRGRVSPELVLGLDRRAGVPEFTAHDGQVHARTLRFERPFLRAELEDLPDRLPSHIHRVKGIVRMEDGPGAPMALHVVGRRMSLDAVRSSVPAGSTVVVIGTRPIDEEILALFESCVIPAASSS